MAKKKKRKKATKKRVVKVSKKTGTSKVIVGVVLLIMALWAFISLPDASAKIIGGGVLAVLGIVSIMIGKKK